MAGLRLRMEDGGSPTVRTLMLRTIIKSAPLLLFLLGWLGKSPWMDVFWWAAAVLAQVYATWYYFAVARRNRSPFDMPVGTRIVYRAEDSVR